MNAPTPTGTLPGFVTCLALSTEADQHFTPFSGLTTFSAGRTDVACGLVTLGSYTTCGVKSAGRGSAGPSELQDVTPHHPQTEETPSYQADNGLCEAMRSAGSSKV